MILSFHITERTCQRPVTDNCFNAKLCFAKNVIENSAPKFGNSWIVFGDIGIEFCKTHIHFVPTFEIYKIIELKFPNLASNYWEMLAMYSLRICMKMYWKRPAAELASYTRGAPMASEGECVNGISDIVRLLSSSFFSSNLKRQLVCVPSPIVSEQSGLEISGDDAKTVR